MGYKAPLNIRFADTGSIGALLGRFRPVSSMRKHLGRRYSVEALYDLDYHDDSDLEKIRLVRAFVVEPLINSTIRIESQSDIGPALKNLLESKLPGIQWQVKDDWSEPFRKYFIIHGSIPAPRDQLTRERMALEIYGKLIQVDDYLIESEKGREWMENKHTERYEADASDTPWPELFGNMVIQIKSATYSNVMYPGVGVPLYG